MARISNLKAESYARMGYVRVSHVAKLLNLTTSGASRWVYRNTIPSLRESNVHWVSWEGIRKFLNLIQDSDGIGLADKQKLPANAEAALEAAMVVA